MNPRNPGEALACCGIFEVSELLAGRERAYFDLDRNLFRIEGKTSLQQCLDWVKMGSLQPLFRHADPPFSIDGKLRLSWWWDPTLTREVGKLEGKEFTSAPELQRMKEFKTWAGQLTAIKLFEEIRRRLPPATADLFEHRVGLKGRFNFDAYSSWGDDFPFSPDATGHFVATSPAVEIFSFIGLQNFRPKNVSHWVWEYRLWTYPIPIQVARAVFTGALKFGLKYVFQFPCVRSGSYKRLGMAKVFISPS